MTNPYRVMCAELFVKLKEWDSSDPYHDCGPLLCRARALLDQPVVEEPTTPNSTLHRQELTPLEITLLNAFWRSR